MSRAPGIPTRLLVGSEHTCGYLPNQQARSAFMDPGLPMTPALYGRLLDIGFRRSGGYVYRPLCRDCHACQSVRIPVARFHADRSQRRCLKHNADLEVMSARTLHEEHFALYRRYLRARHPDGSMDPDDAPAFHEFLGAPWMDTLYLEFRTRADAALLAVAVVDCLPHGLSAVYTFFDPALPHRGLGTYAILREIEITRAMGVPYLYLGYWVPDSPKMDYKRRFQPLEVLRATGWMPLASGA